MIYCIHCGKQLPDDAKFCSVCGRAVLHKFRDEDDQITRSAGNTAAHKISSAPGQNTQDNPVQAETDAQQEQKKSSLHELLHTKIEVNSTQDKVICTVALVCIITAVASICAICYIVSHPKVETDNNYRTIPYIGGSDGQYSLPFEYPYSEMPEFPFSFRQYEMPGMDGNEDDNTDKGDSDRSYHGSDF